MEVRAMRSLLSTLALIPILTIGCTDGGSQRPLVLPEPAIVSADEVPGPAEEIYYLIHPPEGHEGALVSLLGRNIWPLEAWFPVHGTGCLAPTAVNALVVRLPSRNDRIVELGFIPEPGYWLINCGVDSLWEYTFF
jgi:hypothetical protein